MKFVLSVLLVVGSSYGQKLYKGEPLSELTTALGAADATNTNNRNLRFQQLIFCVGDVATTTVQLKDEVVTGWYIAKLSYGPTWELCRQKVKDREEEQLAAQRVVRECKDNSTAKDIIQAFSGDRTPERAYLEKELQRHASAATDACESYRRAKTLREAIGPEKTLVSEEKAMEFAAKRLEVVDGCRKVYADTIDQKESDLTIRQNDLVKGCKTLDLYPPQK